MLHAECLDPGQHDDPIPPINPYHGSVPVGRIGFIGDTATRSASPWYSQFGLSAASWGSQPHTQLEPGASPQYSCCGTPRLDL